MDDAGAFFRILNLRIDKSPDRHTLSVFAKALDKAFVLNVVHVWRY